jgi:4-amino-4-deoxy-L-arabinose transferase-like glycosyltransferase
MSRREEQSAENKRGKRAISVLVVILLFAAAWIRFVDLGTNPPGFWQDEASTGLDAYLIWTTGYDRAQTFLPIISKSFGDYPLAGYRYLTAPIVGLFGLSIAHERLTAAVFGFLMVLVCFLLVRRRVDIKTAIFTLVSCAVCPTWVHFSRYGSEAILLPFCLITGFALFELGKEKPWALWLGALSLGGAAYTYHAVKLVLPLWMAAFLIYHAPLIKKLWRDQKQHLVGPALLFAICILPSVSLALTTEGMARGRTVLAWHHFSGWKLTRVILNNYLSYFDLGLLFVRGGPAVAQSIPGIGLWNLIELPFVLLGLYKIFLPSPHRRFYFFILFWFLLGPLPGGVTYETENIGRVIAWLPAPQIISAIGMSHLFDLRPKTHTLHRYLLPASGFLFVAAWLATYAQVFFLTLSHYPKATKRDWQFEISRVLECAKSKRKDEDIIVSPHLHAAGTFAHFHFYDLKPKDPKKDRAWKIAHRRKVNTGELYVTPAKGAPPQGKRICTITLNAKDLAYVYAAHPSKMPEAPMNAITGPAPTAITPKLKIKTKPPLRVKSRPFPQLKINTKRQQIQGPKPQHR